MKRKYKYDLKKLYLSVDHDYSQGGARIDACMYYKDEKNPVWNDSFKIHPEEVLYKQSWTYIEELMIEVLLEWLEGEVEE
jgi:hypothetical protein